MERLVYIDRYEWQCTPLDVMHSYLSGRTQVVRIDIHTSRYVDLYVGVPQGSVLGHLLFTIK